MECSDALLRYSSRSQHLLPPRRITRAREIRSLCNFAPGSGADLIVRFYSDRLSKLAGRPVIVENRVGANGMIATDALAKSRPDGYTILITP